MHGAHGLAAKGVHIIARVPQTMFFQCLKGGSTES